MASSASLIPQKRKGVTDNERAVLRKRNREHPSSQAELINWYTKETGHKLSQAQISRTLSSKYDYIDNLDKKKDKEALQTQKQREGNWKDLETAHRLRQLLMQKKKVVITGQI